MGIHIAFWFSLLALAPAAPRASDDWSRFLGPGGQGVTREAATLPVDLGAEGALCWKRPVGAGHSSPCIFGQRIFLTSFDADVLETLCLDRSTGAELWRRAVKTKRPERVHEVNGLASPTPTTDGERVHVYFGSFGLLTFDMQGNEVWRREIDAGPNTFGSAASPVLEDGVLYFLLDTNESSYVEALDPAEGKSLWRTERTGFGSGWSTPTLWRRGDRRELLVYGVSWLTAYDPEDGRELWAIPGLADEPIVTPTLGDGLVMVSSYNMGTNTEVIGLPEFEDLLVAHDLDGDGRLSAEEASRNASVLSRFDADGEGDHPLRIFFRFLDGDRDGRLTEEEYGGLRDWLGAFEHANGLVAIRPGEGERAPEIAWQFAQGVPECPSPLLYRGLLYLVKNGGGITCLDGTSGESRYRGRLPARGPFYASPVAGDGKIYCASARGVVSVLEAGPRLRILGTHDLGERILATPALQGGIVYVRTESHLYAFGVPD